MSSQTLLFLRNSVVESTIYSISQTYYQQKEENYTHKHTHININKGEEGKWQSETNVWTSTFHTLYNTQPLK